MCYRLALPGYNPNGLWFKFSTIQSGWLQGRKPIVCWPSILQPKCRKRFNRGRASKLVFPVLTARSVDV